MKRYKACGASGNYFELHLKQKMGFGGEGSVYTTTVGQDVVAKLYPDSSGSDGEIAKYRNKHAKCCFYIDERFEHEGIAFPTHLIEEEDGSFAGYLMPRAKGCALADVMNPLELDERYPDLKRVHLVDVCISVLEKILYLHENGILICDLDMQNIMVDGLGTNEVRTYFIDTDSYQIGEGANVTYRAEVQRPLCTPPELIGISPSKINRSFHNEYFAVTVLLFMILIPGQNPYDMKGRESTQDDGVRDGQFPYPKDTSKASDKIPSKWCQYLWTYLPMGELFWENLHALGSHHSPAERTDPRTWLTLMKSYKKALTDGTVAREDPEGLKAFPERPKRQQSYAVASTTNKSQDQQPKTQRTTSNAKTVKPNASVGPNDPCPCGSGKKYKACHGKATGFDSTKQATQTTSDALAKKKEIEDQHRRAQYIQEINLIKQAADADRNEAEKGYFEDKSSWVMFLLAAMIAALCYWNPIGAQLQYAFNFVTGWLPDSNNILHVLCWVCYPLGWAYVTSWALHRFVRKPLLRKRAGSLEDLYAIANRQEYFGAGPTDAKYRNTINVAKALVVSRKKIEWVLSIIVAALLAIAFYLIVGGISHSIAFSDGLSDYDVKSNVEVYVQGANGEILVDAATESSYGNEADFVQAVVCDSNLKFDRSSWEGDVINVAVGQPYSIRVFVRNDSKEASALANEVRVSRGITREGTDLVYTFSITYNSTPELSNTISDSVRIHVSADWTTIPVLDAQLRSKSIAAIEGRNLINYDALDSEAGCLVGTSKADGVVSGGRDGYCMLYFFDKVE